MTIVAALFAISISKPIASTRDLAGIWEGMSVCSDHVDFPTVHDEQVVYHVAVKDARTVLLTANKLVGGKEESMSDEPMPLAFDARTSTLTGSFGGRKPSTWVFRVRWSTWVGEMRDSEGRVGRNILVKRRA